MTMEPTYAGNQVCLNPTHVQLIGFQKDIVIWESVIAYWWWVVTLLFLTKTN